MKKENEMLITLFAGYLGGSRLLSKRTIDLYCDNVREFCLWCSKHQYNVARLSVVEAREYVNYLLGKGSKKSTINNHVCSLRALFAFLAIQSPFAEKLLHRDKYVRDILNWKVYYNAWKAQIEMRAHKLLPEPILCFYSLLLFTGMRAGEVATLRWDAFRWEQSLISVLGKGRKYRLLPITEQLLGILQRRQEFSTTEYVFDQYTAKELRTGLKADCLGIPQQYLHPHSIRHSYASYLVNQKHIPLTTVQMLLGHSSLATTQIYIHPDVDDLAAAVLSAFGQ